MANEIRVTSSLLAVNEGDEDDIGTTAGDYVNRNVDAHAGRAFGGKYYTLTAYTDADIARFDNAVVAENNTTDGLDSNGWQEGAAGPTSGVLPANVFAIAVEYVAKLGTVANVFVAIKKTGEIRMANLALGESVVIPIQESLTLANVLIGASAYSDGVHEATVNVLVMGT